LDEVASSVEIGWTFYGRKFWGGKYNFAIKTLMINHAFANLEEVIFRAGGNNHRSCAAIEKLGAVREGDAGKIGSVRFVLPKSAWQNGRYWR
jgi:RimJ/RimL family protein N-acetyltransferase